MAIALIIAGIAYIFLTAMFVILFRTIQWKDNNISSVLKDTLEREKEHADFKKEYEVREAIRYAYGISGDIIHHLGQITGRDLKYLPLIETLGEYVRALGMADAPLAYLEHSVLNPDDDRLFPQLDKEQSKELKRFLTEIHDGKRAPDSLLELVYGLVSNDSFENALTQARNWHQSFTGKTTA